MSKFNVKEKVEVTLVDGEGKTNGTWYNAIVIEVLEEKNENVYILDILDKVKLKKSNLAEKQIVRKWLFFFYFYI